MSRASHSRNDLTLILVTTEQNVLRGQANGLSGTGYGCASIKPTERAIAASRRRCSLCRGGPLGEPRGKTSDHDDSKSKAGRAIGHAPQPLHLASGRRRHIFTVTATGSMKMIKTFTQLPDRKTTSCSDQTGINRATRCSQVDRDVRDRAIRPRVARFGATHRSETSAERDSRSLGRAAGSWQYPPAPSSN